MRRSDKHIDLTIEVLRRAWGKNRDQRLCQFIVNANDGEDPYNVEDGKLVEALSGEPMLNTQPIVEDQPMIKVGDRFTRIDPTGKKNMYQIVGAAKGSPDGPCFLASIEYGWSYTGETVRVKDTHHITLDEFKEMSGGQTFVKAEKEVG